jgi:Phage holin family Hol44, in holin superfamily V
MEQLLTAEFTVFIALTLVLYAVREATGISNRSIPLIGLVLGVLLSWLEEGLIDFDTVLQGIQYALYAIGTVAGMKYFVETHKPVKKKSEIR